MLFGEMDPPSAAAVQDRWRQLDEGTRSHLVRVGRLAYELAGRSLPGAALGGGPPARSRTSGGADRPGAAEARGSCRRLTFYYKK